MKSPKGQIALQTRRFFWLFAVAFLLIVLDTVGILSPIKGLAELVVSPIKGAVYSQVVGVGNLYDLVTHFSRVKAAVGNIARLERDSEVLRMSIRQLKAENEALRKQFDAPIAPSYQFIPAEVLGISRYMQIRGGVKEGVEKGMVVVDGNIYIGKVIAVSEHTASVLLANDPDSSIPAKTSRETRGRVVGEFGEKLVLDKVLQKDYLIMGDQVMTSGEEEHPPDLYIGKVSTVFAQDYQVYKRAEILTPLSYDKETMVFVIRSM